MKKTFNEIYLVLFLVFMPFGVIAAQSVDEDERYERENPEFDFIEEDDAIVDIPSFINLDKNKIIYNGNNWSYLKNKISGIDSTTLNIVHIGDSHTQADYATRVVRENLQLNYGDAGRGLVSPLRMCGTNQPTDYAINSPNSWTGFKLAASNWPRTMGFTGVSISPLSHESSIKISVNDRNDYNPFSAVTVFHNGQFFVTSVVGEDGALIPYRSVPSKDFTQIYLTKSTTSALINFDSAGDLTLFGFNLQGNRPGVYYHTIGNNGATFESYNKIGKIGKGINALSPDLVILSLGTNEAFGKFDYNRIYKAIDRLVKDIKGDNPSAEILLVTPMECQKRSYSSAPVKRRKKGRRRSGGGRVLIGYTPNENISKVREVILDYAKNNNISVYDFYEVAGGDKASYKWIENSLFSKDRVHNSLKGYTIKGQLLYNALNNALN